MERGASRYARALLADAGAHGATPGEGEDEHPDLLWARSGAMALCGHSDGPPRLAPGPLAACAEGALRALRALAPRAPLELDASALLGERAACAGLRRHGRTAPGGSCRLIRARDGWLAVNLARESDRELLPAWLGSGDASDAWDFATRRARGRPVGALIERARLLGLPVSEAGARAAKPPPWLRVAARGRANAPNPHTPPRVVDLSALWAGPLCTHLLDRAGARVVKVECRRRPDGARAGDPRFFSLLNSGKHSVALDFTDAADRHRLAALVARADIVVESARPRALRQLGIDAESLVRERPGLTWLSITGYGRSGPEAEWVAFGDDAAAAAGLAHANRDAAGPLFCGDAIADPLTGLHAAVAALASWRQGGGALLDVSLKNVVAHALGAPMPSLRARTLRSEPDAGWSVVLGEHAAPVASPRARATGHVARPLGADTGAVLRELGLAC